VNWQDLTPEGWSISVSYVFDVMFALTVLSLSGKKNYIGKTIPKNLIIRLVLVFGVALLAVTILHLSEPLVAPFKHVNYLFIQILILAPIIEELVFRGAIYELFKNAGIPIWVNNLVNSILFSLSHIAALYALPEEFHAFIYFQLKYTFVLGHLCAKSRERTHGVLEPIILHFAFNLVFYLAVVFYVI